VGKLIFVVHISSRDILGLFFAAFFWRMNNSFIKNMWIKHNVVFPYFSRAYRILE
jgi:hypothetical protein